MSEDRTTVKEQHFPVLTLYLGKNTLIFILTAAVHPTFLLGMIVRLVGD
jgi:hypothetical protein